MTYRTVQWGWFFVPVTLLLGAIEVIVLVGLERSGELTPSVAMITAGLSTVIVLIVLLFSRQVVEVHPDRVVTWFGFGWPRHRAELGEVTAVRRVVNSRWYGWGIRKVPNGWMYNTWGTDAVELALTTGRVFRIGTADPAGLAAEIGRLTGLSVEAPDPGRG